MPYVKRKNKRGRHALVSSTTMAKSFPDGSGISLLEGSSRASVVGARMESDTLVGRTRRNEIGYANPLKTWLGASRRTVSLPHTKDTSNFP